MVGKPSTPTSSHSCFPPAVQSTSAIRMLVESLYSFISLSQSGFIFLQWPHHGARNLTKTDLPAVFSSQSSFVSSVADPRMARVANSPAAAIAFIAKEADPRSLLIDRDT